MLKALCFPGAALLTYPATITLSTSTLTFLTRQLRAHQVTIDSPWRKLPAHRQALLVLAHLRNGDTYQRLAAGFGVRVATAYRYIRKAVDLLAARAPSLTAALWALAWTFNTYAILDGTVVCTDRLGGANNRRYYSGQHRHHGVNLQGLTDPYRRLIWISAGLPGATHDLTAARHHDVLATVNRAGLHLFADKGYLGGEADLLFVPSKGRNLPATDRDANPVHAAIRARGEQAFATLKNWKILTRVRACPQRVGPIAQAILTLENEG